MSKLLSANVHLCSRCRPLRRRRTAGENRPNLRRAPGGCNARTKCGSAEVRECAGGGGRILALSRSRAPLRAYARPGNGMTDVAGEAKRQVKRAAREAAPWVERLARAGYLARGIVYLVVALLAGRAALEHRRPSASRGAMRELLDQPFGRVILGVMAVGLLGYAAWRFVQAVLDPERKGTKLSALAK